MMDGWHKSVDLGICRLKTVWEDSKTFSEFFSKRVNS
jgi:hypothetical protein